MKKFGPKKTKKKKIRRFKLENKVFQYALFIILGGTKDEACQWFEKKFGKLPVPFPAVCGSTLYCDDELSHAIWFGCHQPGGGLVAHEAFHSVCHAFRFIGMGSLDMKNEEAFAYNLQWTVREIGLRVW